HVAGAVALLLEAHPHARPAEVEARLQNSARPHLFSGNPAARVLDNVHRQGAGMLQINDAIEATTVVSPSSLALGEIESGSVTRTPPKENGVRLFGGYITLTPSDDGTVLRVPYAGYNGDYQAIQIFTLAGFPLLAKRTAAGFLPLPNGGLFTMQGDDVPFVLLHLNHQVANL